MTDPTNTQNEEVEDSAPKKVTLEEAIKRKLAQKKADANTKKQPNHQASGVQPMKHQQTKKSNNQRRRTGV